MYSLHMIEIVKHMPTKTVRNIHLNTSNMAINFHMVFLNFAEKTF